MKVPTVILLFIMITTSAVESSVIGWRVYPETDQYRCQSPSTVLNCTFSSDILAVFWSCSVNGTHWEDVEGLKCNGHVHTVNRANLQNWAALTVNDSGELPSNIRYRCTVVLNNGSTDDSDPIELPPSEGTEANFTVFTENVTANSLDVGWDHTYTHCKNYTVLLNKEIISYCERLEPGTRSCHIEHLEPGTEYNVTVIAREHDTADDFAGINVSTLDPHQMQPVGIIVCIAVAIVVLILACCLCATLKKKMKNMNFNMRRQDGQPVIVMNL